MCLFLGEVERSRFGVIISTKSGSLYCWVLLVVDLGEGSVRVDGDGVVGVADGDGFFGVVVGEHVDDVLCGVGLVVLLAVCVGGDFVLPLVASLLVRG